MMRLVMFWVFSLGLSSSFGQNFKTPTENLDFRMEQIEQELQVLQGHVKTGVDKVNTSFSDQQHQQQLEEVNDWAQLQKAAHYLDLWIHVKEFNNVMKMQERIEAAQRHAQILEGRLDKLQVGVPYSYDNEHYREVREALKYSIKRIHALRVELRSEQRRIVQLYGVQDPFVTQSSEGFNNSQFVMVGGSLVAVAGALLKRKWLIVGGALGATLGSAAYVLASPSDLGAQDQISAMENLLYLRDLYDRENERFQKFPENPFIQNAYYHAAYLYFSAQWELETSAGEVTLGQEVFSLLKNAAKLKKEESWLKQTQLNDDERVVFLKQILNEE